jgi:hypothetical protein
MFTLSEKIRVMNSADEIKVLDPAVAETAAVPGVPRVAGASAAGDRLLVEGFGDFDTARIKKFKMRRATIAVQDSSDYTTVAPAGLAIGDVIEVIVTIDTGRQSAEVLAANRINGGRSFVFQTAALTVTTPTAIAAAIVAGMVAWKALFNIGNPLINVIAGAALTDIMVNGNVGGDIDIDRVELRRITQGAAFVTAPVTLAESVVNAIGSEGHGTGKFLEESIRMANGLNTDIYGVDNATTQVDIRGSYTELSFEYASSYSSNLATNAADYGNSGLGGPAVGGVGACHSFTLFVNETTMASSMEILADLMIANQAVAPLLTNTTLNVIAAPLTGAQELIEGLIITDNSSVATSAAFIA